MMYVKDQVLKMVHVIQLRNVKIEKEQAQDLVQKAMEFVVLVSKEYLLYRVHHLNLQNV